MTMDKSGQHCASAEDSLAAIEHAMSDELLKLLDSLSAEQVTHLSKFFTDLQRDWFITLLKQATVKKKIEDMLKNIEE